MKLNKKLAYNAVGSALFHVCGMKVLSEAVVAVINDTTPGAVEVEAVCADGFTIRRKKDYNISDNGLYSAIVEATETLFDKHDDEVIDYIADTYDFAYDPDFVTTDYAEDIFDVTRNGRLISIEADI